MEFGQKLTIMRAIRNMKVDVLAKKAMVDPMIMAGVARGELVAMPALEKRLRQALGWPPEIDDLLEIVARATYANGESAKVEHPHPSPLPSGEVITPTPMPTPTILKPSQILHKKMGQPRKVRPETEDSKIEDDGEVIDTNELRGSVVG